MRLWHKDLIPYLPRQQLIAQWRECCAIASYLANKGTPNHLLVNKILDYPKNHFWNYHSLIIKEMTKRGYKTTSNSMDKFTINYRNWIEDNEPLVFSMVCFNDLFADWHNERYLKQCLYNLQEKYDCGGISEDEWKLIQDNFDKYLH